MGFEWIVSNKLVLDELINFNLSIDDCMPPAVLPTLYDSAASLKCDFVVHGTIFCFHEPTNILLVKF